MYDEIVSLRSYHDELQVAAEKDAVVRTMIISGNMIDLVALCESSSSGENNQSSVGDLLSALTGSQELLEEGENIDTTSMTGSYELLPEDTQELVNDIYQKNIQYIQTMQQTQQDNNYRPLKRLQELFKEFY